MPTNKENQNKKRQRIAETPNQTAHQKEDKMHATRKTRDDKPVRN